MAKENGRHVKFAVNAFVIARETSNKALEEYQYIIENADDTAISQLKNEQKQGVCGKMLQRLVTL